LSIQHASWRPKTHGCDGKLRPFRLRPSPYGWSALARPAPTRVWRYGTCCRSARRSPVRDRVTQVVVQEVDHPPGVCSLGTNPVRYSRSRHEISSTVCPSSTSPETDPRRSSRTRRNRTGRGCDAGTRIVPSRHVPRRPAGFALVLTPNGLIVLELTHWRGAVAGDGVQWTHRPPDGG
jgi:hypothetical protein